MPVITKYSKDGKAHKISAVPAPDSVFTEVEKILEPVFGNKRSAVVPSAADVTVPASAAATGPVSFYNKAPSQNWVSCRLSCKQQAAAGLRCLQCDWSDKYFHVSMV